MEVALLRPKETQELIDMRNISKNTFDLSMIDGLILLEASSLVSTGRMAPVTDLRQIAEILIDLDTETLEYVLQGYAEGLQT
jgi:hypothetical protein